MIDNDQDWLITVKGIADGTLDKESGAIHNAAGYLWDSMNWDHLKNTTHGKYLREVSNPCPDLLLRSMYRKQLLGA